MSIATDEHEPELAREALAAADRPRRFGAWYVTEHRLLVLRSYGGTVVGTAIGTPLLYLLAFGLGLGSLVSANLGPEAVDGVSYLVFVAPALIATAAINIAGEEFTYPVMLGFKWNPTFVGMNAAPLTARQIMNGVILMVVLRMVVAIGLYYAVMVVFGAVPSPWGVLVVPISMLTGLAFGTPLLAYSASLREDRGQFAVVMRVIVLPVALFSGTVFPLDQLPVYLQWIGWISPLWHGTELARVAAYGSQVPGWLIAVHLVVLVGATTVGWLLAGRIATRRLGR